MKNIRLGVVRADTHGVYFGLMMNEPDPKALLEHNYVVHHYATSIYDPGKITAPQVSGFEITGIYDYDPKQSAAFSKIFHGKPTVFQTLEEMAEDVDAVFVGDCDGGGGDHLALATPFLKKGLPTFVDKPFASTLKDALEIVKLAEENNAPLFNASILTYVPAASHFKQRFQEIANAYYPVPDERPSQAIGLGVIKGVGGAFSQELAGKGVRGGLEDRLAYIIHGVSLALNLYGKDVEWVEAMGDLPLEYLHLHLKSGVEVMILNTSTDIFPESCSFYASAFSKFGAVHSEAIGDPEFLGGGRKILEMFGEMVRTGKPPVAYSDFIKHIAIIEAAQQAQKKGNRVLLEEVWSE